MKPILKYIARELWIAFATVVIMAALVMVVFMILHSKSNGCRRHKDSQKLPVIYLSTHDEIPWEGKVPCSVNLVTNTDSTIWSGKIKFRGGISSKYPKHSYALKLKDAQTLCGLPANRSWILNANYIDKTFMRHKLCYDLFRQMDSNNIAPKCAYALVRENGNPQGLYVVMQRLNEHTLPLCENDPDAVIFKEPKIFYQESKLPDRAEYGGDYHGQTYPKFEEIDRSGLMDSLREYLLHTPDNTFYATVGQRFDLHNLIDWHLLLLFMNGGDNVLKNFYLYRPDGKTPYRIAIWDCDHSFGRDCDNEKNMLKQLLEDERNILLKRMMKSPDYRSALSKRYRQLRQSGIFSYENMEKMIRENDRSVRLGLEENLRLWPFDSDNYYDAAGYDEECALILEFVALNLARLDQQMGFTPTH